MHTVISNAFIDSVCAYKLCSVLILMTITSVANRRHLNLKSSYDRVGSALTGENTN